MEAEELKTIYGMVESQLERQTSSRDRLDAKVGLLFGVAGLMIGFVWTARESLALVWWVGSMLLLTGSLGCLLRVIWTKAYFVAPEPSAIVADHDQGKDIPEILKAAIAGMVKAYEDNWGPYNSNVRWYRTALVFVSFGIVVGLIGTAIS